MEDPGGTGAETAAPSPAAKSKLDTLSKDDLIKFCKKQMAAMQKMKSRCADLEKEIESFKQSGGTKSSPDDTSLIQELTERMDALLLQKAEIQQSLVMTSKNLEKTKQQAKDDVAKIQGELSQVLEDHKKKITALESSLNESNTKHREEVAYFQNLLKEREEEDRARESERERQRQAEHASVTERVDEVRQNFVVQLENLRAELEENMERNKQEIAELQEGHQKELTKSQQEVENLREELAQKSLQHDEEMRALEEDFEIERDRLLLLHEELTEQLALKDSFLQDVQEEEEEPTHGSGIAKMLALSRMNQVDLSTVDGDDTDGVRMTAALEDLQSKNTMLQDELTLLSNVKTEMEAELERIKEEFQVEREELEFKINEMQMSKENSTIDPDMTTDAEKQEVQVDSEGCVETPDEHQLKTDVVSDLCETLRGDTDAALKECQNLKDKLEIVERELGEKTCQYETMKEQEADTLRELQDMVEQLTQERETLLTSVKEVTEENSTLMESLAKQKQELEVSAGEDQKLHDQRSAAMEELTRQNEELMAQMQVNETITQDLKEELKSLTEEHEKMQSLLRTLEEEKQKVNEQKAKDFEILLEEKENEFKALKEAQDNKVKQFSEEKEKIELSLKEEIEKERERFFTLELSLKGERDKVSALEMTIKELDSEKTELHQKLEEASSGFAEAQEESELLGSKLSALEAELEQETSEKCHLEVRLKAVTEEAEQSRTSVRELEERMTEVLRQSTEDAEELRARGDQRQDDEMQQLSDPSASEFQTLLEEKAKELIALKEEKETEVQQLNEERRKTELRLEEEMEKGKETVSALETAIKELHVEKNALHQNMEEASSALVKAQEERDLLGSKLSALEAQLEEEKRHLEEKLKVMTEEAEQARASVREQEEKLKEVLRNSTEEAEELRARVEELGEEKDLLKTTLQHVQQQAEATAASHQDELQAHIQDLEKERMMLKSTMEEMMKDNEGLQRDLLDMKAVCEKISEENHTLQAQINLMAEGKPEEETEVKEEEKTQYVEQLTEKDSLISKLRSEMAALQESADQSASSEEKAGDEITKKIELLQKDNKDKEERFNKVKAVAVKAKKELDLSKKEVANLKEEIESLKAERERRNSSMKDIIHGAEGYKNLQIDYDKQTEQLDKEKERAEAAERQITELTKRLSSAVTQTETLTSEKEDLMAGLETMRNTVRQLEGQNQDLQKQSASLDKDLLTERAMKEQKMKDLSSAVKEVEELTAQLQKQQQQSQQTAQELEQLRKEAQQNSLLDMEMADYERLVKELNTKISEKDELAEELKSQIDTLSQKEDKLRKENESLKSQIDQEEEKTSKMKQLLVKTKKDLADSKKQESSLMMRQAFLQGELEANQQLLESSKIEMSELTADRHRLQEQLRSALEQQQRTNVLLQQRISSLQTERDNAKAELVATTSEFESYKVRVHNVLKQQKTKTTAQGEGDGGKQDREQWSSQVAQLKTRLTDSQQNLQSCTAELQQLQIEHDTLLERHNKILQENIGKEAELRERLLSVQSENVTLRSDLSQTQADQLSQIEAQRQAYREQMRKVQDDHRTIVETLQSQLTRVEEQLYALQSQNSPVSMHANRKPLGLDIQRRNGDQIQAGLGMMSLSDVQSMAREEGEGMEMIESESPSPALTPLPSLEQLLTSPDPKQEPFVWTVEPTKEELNQKLSTATRSMEHMNSLLHETEATNAVLMEQITLLKSEVRRLERNQEREKSVANLEYLKNVLLQFIFLRSGSERQALLPVIHTMLQLSPEEKSKLSAIAQGAEEGPASRGTGWSSYLHSWSGIR